jgi:hypothetical protein
MDSTVEECIEMGEVVEEAGVIFGLRHGEDMPIRPSCNAVADSGSFGPVMRHSSYLKEISETIASGSLGELANALHVRYYHFTHSYV